MENKIILQWRDIRSQTFENFKPSAREYFKNTSRNKNKHKTAVEKLEQDIKFSHELRDKLLQERVTQATTNNNFKEESAIKSILNCEQIKRL